MVGFKKLIFPDVLWSYNSHARASFQVGGLQLCRIWRIFSKCPGEFCWVNIRNHHLHHVLQSPKHTALNPKKHSEIWTTPARGNAMFDFMVAWKTWHGILEVSHLFTFVWVVLPSFPETKTMENHLPTIHFQVQKLAVSFSRRVVVVFFGGSKTSSPCCPTNKFDSLPFKDQCWSEVEPKFCY